MICRHFHGMIMGNKAYRYQQLFLTDSALLLSLVTPFKVKLAVKGHQVHFQGVLTHKYDLKQECENDFKIT